MPSNGGDAVKMLRTCTEEAWERGRVVVFVEPIALYMTRDLHEANDKEGRSVIRKSAKRSESVSLGFMATARNSR